MYEGKSYPKSLYKKIAPDQEHVSHEMGLLWQRALTLCLMCFAAAEAALFHRHSHPPNRNESASDRLGYHSAAFPMAADSAIGARVSPPGGINGGGGGGGGNGGYGYGWGSGSGGGGGGGGGGNGGGGGGGGQSGGGGSGGNGSGGGSGHGRGDGSGAKNGHVKGSGCGSRKCGGGHGTGHGHHRGGGDSVGRSYRRTNPRGD